MWAGWDGRRAIKEFWPLKKNNLVGRKSARVKRIAQEIIEMRVDCESEQCARWYKKGNDAKSKLSCHCLVRIAICLREKSICANNIFSPSCGASDAL
jgi:hypothetical protein